MGTNRPGRWTGAGAHDGRVLRRVPVCLLDGGAHARLFELVCRREAWGARGRVGAGLTLLETCDGLGGVIGCGSFFELKWAGEWWS